ncbi:MAG TPA: NrfD/PsrC family molybdoenzyme membrane anchor subunit [Acidimicrobiales bacterium]|nr:NrfD/PsrC family molybdoenzyme membrane anchor subunit [Acidimicrobiales bacterium]
MKAQATFPRLPLGVGRVTSRWLVFAGVAGVVLVYGMLQYWRQLTEGLVVTALRDPGSMGGAPWGLYIAFDVYFVGVSFAGITVAALIRLLDLEKLKPVARMAEVLTVSALVLAALSTVADLGQPVRGVVNLFRYARPQSPFYGTFTLVLSGYLFASVVYLFLDGRRDAARMARLKSRLSWLHRGWATGYTDTEPERARHGRASFWLAVAILPLLITAHSTLGFVFGLQVGRPGWYSALQAPAFVVMAGASGIGILTVLAAVMRRALRQQGRLTVDLFATLGRFSMVLLAVYLYFMTVELLTVSYAGAEHEREVSRAILTGDYAWIYWSSVALLVLPFAALLWQTIRHRWSIGLLVACGIAVNLAAIGKRFLIVVPSLTKGALLPYDPGSYTPSAVEIGIILGLFALGALIIGGFAKVFPIMELPEDEPVVDISAVVTDGKLKEAKSNA